MPEINFHSPYVEIALKLLLAVAAGGIIGLEREWKRKPAGLRTNILICVSAALLMITSRHISGGAPYSDPARLVAQVVVGIGFIGAGVILRYRGTVIGLTSAATILAVTAIGISIGDGMFGVAIGVTMLIVVVLTLLEYLEAVIVRRRRRFHFTFHTQKPAEVQAQILELLEKERLQLVSFDIVEAKTSGYEINLTIVTSPAGSKQLVEKLAQFSAELKTSSFDTN